MAAEIIVRVDANGDVEIEVDGVQGPSCMDLTKELEAEFGEITTRERKKEFAQRAQAQTRTNLRGRVGR